MTGILEKERVTIRELEELCSNALQKKGATPEEAKIVFSDYLDAELRGRTSHGFVSFTVALAAFPHPGQYEVSSAPVLCQRSQGTAIKVGISRGYLQHLLSGIKNPSVKLAKKIEEATGGKVTKEELLFPEEYPEKGFS